MARDFLSITINQAQEGYVFSLGAWFFTEN